MVRKNFIRAARASLVTCDPGRSMSSPVSFLAAVHCLRPLSLVVDLIRLVALVARPRAALVAENLCRRTRSCVGAARDSASSGVGSRRALAARMKFLQTTVSSGRWELIVVSGSSVCFSNSYSGLGLWIPAIGEPTEGNDSQEFRLDSTGCYGIRRVF